MSSSCKAPFTGPDCTETYAQAAGHNAYLGYRLTFISFGVALISITGYELYKLMKDSGALSNNGPAFQQQQNYQKSVYWRIMAASLVFGLCALDPLGYSDIVGVRAWIILSGVSTFFVLSVCISLIFAVVRGIALVGSKHGILPYFNALYLYSQLAMLGTWIVLPVIQALVSEGYAVEAVKLICSSLVFLTWSMGSLAYGASTLTTLRKTGASIYSSNRYSSQHPTSEVLMQRLSMLRLFNKLLAVFSFLSIIFVGVQTVDAIHAIKSKDQVNFGVEDSVPTGYGDLFISGIFETLKQVFCFLVLFGMRYVRFYRQSSIAEQSHKGEKIPLAEIHGNAGDMQLQKGEQFDDENSESSQTAAILDAAIEHNAAA